MPAFNGPLITSEIALGSELVVQNTSGLLAIGEVAGGHASYIYPGSLDASWKFVGTGDYSGGQVHYTQVGSLPPDWTFH